jgi:RNA-directed DNA polymerase
MPHPALSALARSFLAGDQAVDQIVARATQTLGRPWRWLRPLARRYAAIFAAHARPRRRDVIDFFWHDAGFADAWSKHGRQVSVANHLIEPRQMQPVAAAAAWDIPAIRSAGDLAAWLQLDPSELDWFADLKDRTRKQLSEQLRHYRYRVLLKNSGRIRLIEAPKPRLKQLQRQILSRILDLIPPHPAAHGFRRGRSIKTFVAPHTAQRVVLRMDLQDFFPSITGARIQAFFRTAGYPESVADLLGGLCTNAAPRDIWKCAGDIDPSIRRAASDLYIRPHLPQGAPTSPALANFCAYRIDCRLAGLAWSAGAAYTRYADDLAFSGGADFDRCVERFSTHVAAILHEEGFQVHHRKTRIMRQGVRQHLAGLVANQRVNVARADFDRLKATLTNCIRHGLESQNREAHPSFRAHLAGRVAFVEMVNPERGARLRALLDRI